jgi:hypothetical protein
VSVKYLCDANPAHEIKKQHYGKNIIDGKHYCNKCAPKVRNVLRTLDEEYSVKFEADKSWYESEKITRIAAACPASVAPKEVVKDG